MLEKKIDGVKMSKDKMKLVVQSFTSMRSQQPGIGEPGNQSCLIRLGGWDNLTRRPSRVRPSKIFNARIIKIAGHAVMSLHSFPEIGSLMESSKVCPE